MLAFAELRSRFAQSEGLPFSEVLTEENIRAVLDRCGVAFRDRVFNPITTVWGFLSQVLSDDHSCQDAVARIIAHRSARGQEICSPNTAAFCKARLRLPLQVVECLAKETAQKLESQAIDEWKWLGRSVKIIDGTTVSMPDTEENQAAFPQMQGQEEGIGFPLARMAALFSLSTGACLDCRLGPWSGKGSSERALFRQMFPLLKTGDVILADRYYDSYFEIAMLWQRGIDVVFRVNERRHTSEYQELGDGDRIVVWKKPARPDWLDKKAYDALPKVLPICEVTVDVSDSGNRMKKLIVGSTLVRPQDVPKEEFAKLYQYRWHCELDLRSIKQTMKMDVLRCKTPDMVQKEIWVHLLAFNLLRTVMAAAAKEHDAKPREISFKAAKQAVAAFATKMEDASPAKRLQLLDDLLRIIAYHRVGDRPGRFEPRAVKRRPKKVRLLMVPRAEAKRQENRRKWQ
jgi:hypothetical protein